LVINARSRLPVAPTDNASAIYTRGVMNSPKARSLAVVVVCLGIALQISHLAAQTSTPRLAWDSPLTGIKGFAVTIDGARRDYGLTPVPSTGSCGCAVPLSFSGGRHTIVVSSYNSQGESSAPALSV